MGCIWAYGSKILMQVNVIAKEKSQENSTHLLLWEQINSFTIFAELCNHQKKYSRNCWKFKVKWISSSRDFSINKEIHVDHKPLLDKRKDDGKLNNSILIKLHPHPQALLLGLVSVHGSATLPMGVKIIFYRLEKKRRKVAALTDNYDHRWTLFQALLSCFTSNKLLVWNCQKTKPTNNC